MTTTLPLSSVYLSLLGLVMLGLAYTVVRARMQTKIGLGDHGNKAMAVAMRAHANAVEYIPMLAILFILAEINQVTPWLLHPIGLTLVIARIAHGYGFIKCQGKTHPGRFYGTLFTWIGLLTLALLNIMMVFTG